MRENKLSIVINRPTEEVFSYTLNPKNTHLWIDFIEEEKTDGWPPKVGTIYKNKSKGNKKQSHYELIELIENKTFTLKRIDLDDYFVKYSFNLVKNNMTKFEYNEWTEDTDIYDPFQMKYLDKLKSILEKSK